MKRSEMAFKLQQAIYAYTQRLVSLEDAIFILKDLEKSGMLPPEIDKVIEKHDCTVNEWEPENE